MEYKKELGNYKNYVEKYIRNLRISFLNDNYIDTTKEYCTPLKALNHAEYETLIKDLEKTKNLKEDFYALREEFSEKTAENNKKHNLVFENTGKFSIHSRGDIIHGLIDGVVVMRDGEPFSIRPGDIYTPNKLDKYNKIKNEKKAKKFLDKHPDVKKLVDYTNAKKKADEYFKDDEAIKKEENLAINALLTEYWSPIESKINKSEELHKINSKILLSELITNNIKDFNLNPRDFNEIVDLSNDINSMQDLKKVIATVKTASALHENWRQGRFNAETNTFEPRWKTVAPGVETSPNATVRINNDGIKEIDIANTSFNDLTVAWQLENFNAASYVVDLATNKNAPSSTKEIGSKIHEAWLKRNPWAKNTELGVSFEKLSKEEQMKDIEQYQIASKLFNEVNAFVDINLSEEMRLI